MSVDRILSWFPNTWRARYEAEVRELLAAQPFTWRTAIDLVAACVDAWLQSLVLHAPPRLRRTLHTASRIGALLCIGGIGVLAADVLAPALEASPWWTSSVGAVANIAWIITVFLAGLFYIRPFMEDPARRPGLLPSLSLLIVFFLAVALDGSTARLGDVVGFGIIATMRYSWFHVDTYRAMYRSSLAAPRSILGLR
jgi:hypothetical protein